MLLLGIFRDTDGNRQENLYTTWSAWHNDTWNPTVKIITQILFKISGKTYAEKKANLQELAKEWQYCECWLSYGELAEVYAFFEKNAKRYGLVKEFKENCII